MYRLSEHYGVDLFKHLRMPFTLSKEHCKYSPFQERGKRWATFEFKDLSVVYNKICGAHRHNTLLVDESPTKNLLNNPYNNDRGEPAVSYR